ncbi:MAG TPA: methyltransferase domain-containing protein [Woeseiaceae bacterium]|nr:methyltransferase domain-containing protein [Woeseiaceae bacterium]
MMISRNGAALPLPASRKARALFAFLAVSPAPVSRSHLCELLWDVPNDPRGELRWCLSKLRRILDEPGRRRVETGSDTIRLDLADCFVDALEVARAAREGIGKLEAERLRAISELFAGEFLEGLELYRSPDFTAWVMGERRRFHAGHLAVLAQLAKNTAGDEAFTYLESWMKLAPFDPRVHEMLLTALARRGRIRDAEEHLTATARQFEAEGLDPRPIRNLWRIAWAKEGMAAQAGGVPLVASMRRGADSASAGAAASRASVAVMPFDEWADPDGTEHRGGRGGELVHDVIARLTGLRSFRVLAQSGASGPPRRPAGPADAAATPGADYLVTGSVRRQERRLAVAVELVETRAGRIVWAEVFHHTLDDALQSLEETGNRLVASIANEIETVECNRALLKPPGSVDAWEAHHRGLWHLYRFDRTENDRARHFFELAVRLDPTFARAYAGLSFTHLQDAFQGWREPGTAGDRAFEAAGLALLADARDPAAHWAMGHVLSLRGQQGESMAELEMAVDLSPDFALDRFALAFVRKQHRVAAPPEFAALTRQHPLAAPAGGDHAVIGTTLPLVGELLADACGLHWDEHVLDVAAGSDSIVLAAARRGCKVTSTEVPSGLRPEAGKAHADALQPGFRPADSLPFADASFEAVVSTFGVMFSTDPAKTASELTRVCRPGGRIGLASWTPEGFIGRILKALGRYLRPLAGVQSPWLWGVEAYLWSLFGKDAAGISATRRTFNFRFHSAAHFLHVLRSWCAPLQRAFAALLAEKPVALEHDLLELLDAPDRADTGPLVIPGEYLEVVITRA